MATKKSAQPLPVKKITDNTSLAWNAGENGEFFNKLFDQLPFYSTANTEIYMILAENCNTDLISQIASKAGFRMKMFYVKKVKWERNFIYRLSLSEE